MSLAVTNINPASNNPLPAILQCDVNFPPAVEKGPIPSVVFLLLDEGNNDNLVDRISAAPDDPRFPTHWRAPIDASKLHNGSLYSVLVVAKLKDSVAGNVLDSGSGISHGCVKNP